MAGLDDWLTVARTADPDELRERILTGSKTGKPFSPYVPTVELPRRIDRLLDFGCGVGRNFSYVKTIARHVAGFDLPPMIERCRALATEPVDSLSSDWNEVRARRFDLIFASLVLQHIEPEICLSYLMDFASMAPAVYVLSRNDSDFGSNVLDSIAATDMFEPGECVKVEHHPETHQLQVLGRMSFADARRATDSGHYEVLLRSK